MEQGKLSNVQFNLIAETFRGRSESVDGFETQVDLSEYEVYSFSMHGTNCLIVSFSVPNAFYFMPSLLEIVPSLVKKMERRVFF